MSSNGLTGMNHAILSRDEERALLNTYCDGTDIEKRCARDKLVASNMRLVASIALRYKRYAEMADMMQEGSIGLMRALELFNVDRGTKFATYASWWIRQSIIQFITNRTASVRLPAHVHGIKRKMFKLNELRSVALTPAELAKKLNISLKMAQASINATTSTVSLDAQRYGNSDDASGSASWSGFVHDADAPTQSDAYDHAELVNIIRKSLKTLSKREETVLRLRFGIAEEPTNASEWPASNFAAA